MHQQSRLTATPSRLIDASTSAIPTIFMLDALPCTTLAIYPGLGQATNMLACIPGGLVTNMPTMVQMNWLFRGAAWARVLKSSEKLLLLLLLLLLQQPFYGFLDFVRDYTWVSSTRKVKSKPMWISWSKRQWGSGISWVICKSAPCPRQITVPAPHLWLKNY